MRDGIGNYQKAFPLFGTETGIIKMLSRYSGWEWETKTILPAVREQEFKAFPLGNLREREFPLMPVKMWLQKQIYSCRSNKVTA